MSIPLTPHCARPHASEYALELLADEIAERLPSSARSTLYRIGSRERPDAYAAEWAFLHFIELALGIRHQLEGW
jgi:hypothetical protein